MSGEQAAEFARAVMDSVVRLAGVMVADLSPGDLVNQGRMQATFIAQTEHPIWPHLRLVIWRMPKGSGLPGDWSHDALDARQVVGTVVPATAYERQERLRAAILGGRDD